MSFLRQLPRNHQLPAGSQQPIVPSYGTRRNGRYGPKAAHAWFGHRCGLPSGQGSKHGSMKPSTDERRRVRLHEWRTTPVRPYGNVVVPSVFVCSSFSRQCTRRGNGANAQYLGVGCLQRWYAEQFDARLEARRRSRK